MRLLFVGDVVGPEVVAYLARRLPALRQELGVDLTLVNAENCGPTGVGMTMALVERLLDAGADVVTAGNHAFEGSEVEPVLAHPRVLRPLNLADGVAGRGQITVDTGSGAATVLVLADRGALALAPKLAERARSPYRAWSDVDPNGTVIVDFHGESVMQKQAFAHAVDGRVAAVLGTHTHEPTLHLDILAGGTALVTEVGMTGARTGIQGFEPRRFVEIVRGAAAETAAPPCPAIGPITLGAVAVDIEGGVAHRVRRIS
jgi:calcineurin-like phosphoesterase